MLFFGIAVWCFVKVHAGRFTLWSLGLHWILPDLHGFLQWVFDALGLLSCFVRQVVVLRSASGLHRRADWLREYLSSRP